MESLYALRLAYRGTRFAGWQRQENALAIQQVVEDAVADLMQAAVTVVGAGRTDAGVHARGQVAHLELPREFPIEGLVHGVNQRLPEDVRVMAAARMPAGFHARKSAVEKEYVYTLSRQEILDPLEALFAVRVPATVDVEAMRQASASLIGKHDFTAFALSGGSHGSPVREVKAAEWTEAGHRLHFRIVGDGFLRGMVRSIVGTIVEVGRGKRLADSIDRLLTGVPRSESGPTAPPEGLTLESVSYPADLDRL